jgi:hypothetical protein
MHYFCCTGERTLIEVFSVLLICGLFSSGCSSKDPASRIGEMNDTRIKQLANLYMAHQMRNGSNGPKDQPAFKSFIQNGMAPHRLEMMRVDPAKVDDLFVSERDGQPFIVKYGQSGGTMSKLPVVFEMEGQGGSRQVAFTNGQVEDVDEARYQELLRSGKKIGATSGVSK